MTREEYKELLIIDKYKLDEVCQQHSDIFFKVSGEFTIAVSRRDELKDKLKFKYSTLFLRYKLTGVEGKAHTDKSVDNMLTVNKEYVKLSNEYLEFKTEAQKWGDLKESFFQRADMIRQLCKLHGDNYYADIVVKGGKTVNNTSYEELRKQSASVLSTTRKRLLRKKGVNN